MRMIKRLVFILIAVLSSVCFVNADNNTDNAAVVDYETNFKTPVVTPKAAASVKKHIGDIGNALSRNKFNTDMVRKGEVTRLTIPCSEFFISNDTSLTQSAKTRLAALKPILQQPTMYKVIVAVYTDDTGDEMYANDITWSRAAAIYDFLYESAEVKNPNVVPYGMGHDDSKAANNSIKNRALNRRVEILIVPEWNLIKDATSGKLN